MNQKSITSDIIGQLRQTPGCLWVKTPGCLQEMFFDRTGLPGLDGDPSAYKVFLIDETDDRVYGVGSLAEVSGELLFTELEYYIESPVYARKDGKAGLMEPGEAEGILDGIQPYTGKRAYLDYEPVSGREEEVRYSNYMAGLITDKYFVCFGNAEDVREDRFTVNKGSCDETVCLFDGLKGLAEGDFVRVKGELKEYALTDDPEDPDICRHINVSSVTVFGSDGAENTLCCAGPALEGSSYITEELLRSLKNDKETLWLYEYAEGPLKAFVSDITDRRLERQAERLTGKPEASEDIIARARVFMLCDDDMLYAIGHPVRLSEDKYAVVADYLAETPVSIPVPRRRRSFGRAMAMAMLDEIKPFGETGLYKAGLLGDSRFCNPDRPARFLRVRGIVSDVDDDTIYLRCGKETVRCELRDHQQEGNLLFKRGDTVTVEGVMDNYDDIEVHKVITDNV